MLLWLFFLLSQVSEESYLILPKEISSKLIKMALLWGRTNQGGFKNNCVFINVSSILIVYKEHGNSWKIIITMKGRDSQWRCFLGMNLKFVVWGRQMLTYLCSMFIIRHIVSSCDALHDFVPFAQIKKVKNTHEGVLLSVICNFTKSNTPLWEHFTFFNCTNCT